MQLNGTNYFSVKSIFQDFYQQAILGNHSIRVPFTLTSIYCKSNNGIPLCRRIRLVPVSLIKS
ncbi:hypothetical protein BLOT_008360 [Blomia tropicalis]|nr:hypothetical protein BLOT_008360 [Blomia tropicalis]